MMYNYLTERVTVPTAFVTKGRQRVKQFHNSVYLRNGDEFEIELFNPTSKKVLAKIDLNGKSLGSGIILRPGERVFLERYFDEAKKFRFETYEVEANNPNVEQAIQLNGLVKVEFYDEQYRPNPYTITYASGSDWVWNPGVTQPSIMYNTGTAKGVVNPTFTTSGNVQNIPAAQNLSGEVKFANANNLSAEAHAFYCCSMDAQMDLKAATPISQKVETKETGRVEKGSNSNQSFVYDDTAFNSWSSWRTTWRILPDSQKPRESHDLKSFCPFCGAKQKKHTHKFCPICGTRYE